MATKIYDKERLHTTPVDVAAQALGYKSANNGASLSVLASLRYFGIVERPKDGFLAINKNFESYKFAPDERIRRSILISYLQTPPLYGELLDKYSSGLPSEANLRFELIQKGFTPQASESALEVFLKSVEFAGFFNQRIEMGFFDQRTQTEAVNDRESTSEPVEVAQPSNVPKVHLDRPQVINSVSEEQRSRSAREGANVDEIPVRLPGGRKAWLIIPTPFYEADKARIKAQIDLLLAEDEN